MDVDSPGAVAGAFSLANQSGSIPLQTTFGVLPRDSNSVFGAGSSEMRMPPAGLWGASIYHLKKLIVDGDILRLHPLIEEDPKESEIGVSPEDIGLVSSDVPAEADYNIPIELSDNDFAAEWLQNIVSETHQYDSLADELHRAPSSELPEESLKHYDADTHALESPPQAIVCEQDIPRAQEITDNDGLAGSSEAPFANSGSPADFPAIPSTLSTSPRSQENVVQVSVSRESQLHDTELESQQQEHLYSQEDERTESQRNEPDQGTPNRQGVTAMMRMVVVLHGSDGSVRVAQIPLGFGFSGPSQPADGADSAPSPPIATTSNSNDVREANENGGEGDGEGNGGQNDVNDYDSLVRLADLLGPARPRHAHIEDVREQLPPLIYKGDAFRDSLPPLDATLVNSVSIAENTSDFSRLKGMLGETREKCTICLMNYEEDDEMRILRPMAILDIISALILGRMLSSMQRESTQPETEAIPEPPVVENNSPQQTSTANDVASPEHATVFHQTPPPTATATPPAATSREATPTPLNFETQANANPSSAPESTEEASQPVRHDLRDALFPLFAHLFLRELLLEMAEHSDQESNSDSPQDPSNLRSEQEFPANEHNDNDEHSSPHSTPEENQDEEDEDSNDLFEILARMNATLGRSIDREVPTPPLVPPQNQSDEANEDSDSADEMTARTRPLGSEFRLLDELLLRFGEDTEDEDESEDEDEDEDTSPSEGENFHLEPLYVHREVINSLYGEDIDDTVDH
ncbi:hypothetical protein HDU84_003777 [Entophlyctis sp. JEL0112]|nr:hypothetical protein HDU84_003777 [Entophlyctis sp. JEL0112]